MSGKELVEISFPGLGIEPFTVDKVAIPINDKFDIRWYGILIMVGMVLAFVYAIVRAKSAGFTLDDVLDIGLYTVIFGVIGARLYYVLMRLDHYIYPGRGFFDTLLDMINLRGGGLAIYGGVLAGVATIIIYSKIKKKNWWAALDMIAPGVMIAQAMGRWGNFFNGEAHGGIVDPSHPLYFMRMGLYPNDLGTSEMAYVHPTFLYESLWNILGFVLIQVVYYRCKKKKFDGQVALSYLAWYGFGRMFIEGLRTDSLYIGPIRISQLVGFLCFAVCTGLMIFMLHRARKLREAVEAEEYVPMYGAAAQQEKADAAERNEAQCADDENNNENQEKKEEE
ncbi:MAG: prolipoprotein diacylglyceryl transferase [Clostridia bacterium]|nr:prolipoprotein diacylglyceryl transferase [Clostridia bacterium]